MKQHLRTRPSPIAMVAAVAVSSFGSLFGIASCSSDASAPAASEAAVVAATPTTTSTVTTPAITVPIGPFGEARTAACDLDLAALQIAVDLSVALHGDEPRTEAQVVADGLLKAQSPLHDIDASNRVVPSPGSGCTT
ncbi:MAG: hypothetical protein ABIW84_09380 [Ilumatobacteraceae bacterium]